MAQPREMSNSERNMMARNAVLASAIDRWTGIYTNNFGATGNLGRVVNVPIRNVGLIKRFLVKCTATVQRSAAETHTRTPWGPANFLSSVIFSDLSNHNRISTAGWHLYALASARRMMAYTAAYTNDVPLNMGSNYTINAAPAEIQAEDQTVTMWYEIPISYGDRDLRGAIYASVVNATLNLQLTVNPNFSVATATDETLAVYQSSTADLLTMSALNITVYQNYLDQIPVGRGGPIIPGHDVATAYLIQNTVATGMAAGQDFAIPYANFRDFMSTIAIYDQNGTLNAGTDINYWAMRVANFTEVWRLDPIASTLLNNRNLIGNDFPAGAYYFDHRNRPVNTVQYGNMELVMNPITVAASSQMLVGYEMLTIINQVTQAGSLYNT